MNGQLAKWTRGQTRKEEQKLLQWQEIGCLQISRIATFVVKFPNFVYIFVLCTNNRKMAEKM